MIKESRGLLGAQGIRVFQPQGIGEVVADVSVEPLPGTPEWLLYKNVPRRVSYRISERDSWRALSLALTAPRDSFNFVIVGVDPGRLCAASIVADGILLRAWKTPCSAVGESIASMMSRIPSLRFEVILGSGPGMSGAASSLAGSGLPFTVADESWTTSRPALWRILGVLGDRDLVASATIALTRSTRWG